MPSRNQPKHGHLIPPTLAPRMLIAMFLHSGLLEALNPEIPPVQDLRTGAVEQKQAEVLGPLTPSKPYHRHADHKGKCPSDQEPGRLVRGRSGEKPGESRGEGFGGVQPGDHQEYPQNDNSDTQELSHGLLADLLAVRVPTGEGTPCVHSPGPRPGTRRRTRGRRRRGSGRCRTHPRRSRRTRRRRQ